MAKSIKQQFKNVSVEKVSKRSDWNGMEHSGYVIVTRLGETYDVYVSSNGFVLR